MLQWAKDSARLFCKTNLNQDSWFNDDSKMLLKLIKMSHSWKKVITNSTSERVGTWRKHGQWNFPATVDLLIMHFVYSSETACFPRILARKGYSNFPLWRQQPPWQCCTVLARPSIPNFRTQRMHSQRLNSTSELMHLFLDHGQCVWAAAFSPSITDHFWFSSLLLPNSFSACIAYQTFKYCWWILSIFETSLLFSLILSTFAVDPDGYLCSSQHHVGWSCCLCSDVVFRSSGFASECLEANAGADRCSRVCPRIGSRVRSRDCTSDMVSRVRSWGCTSDMVSRVRSRGCTSVVSWVRTRDGSHILCGAGFLHHSNGATRFDHQLHSLDLALWFTKLWIGASGHSRECFERRHGVMNMFPLESFYTP
jgi:hypothetical protein